MLTSILDSVKKALGLEMTDLASSTADRDVVQYEQTQTINGVDFSRIQIDKIIQDKKNGREIEFETFSPYIADYNQNTGEIWTDKLT